MGMCEWELQTGTNSVRCYSCTRMILYNTLVLDPVGKSNNCTGPFPRPGNPGHVFLSTPTSLECLTCGHKQTFAPNAAVQLTCPADCPQTLGLARALTAQQQALPSPYTIALPPPPAPPANTLAAALFNELDQKGWCDFRPAVASNAYRCTKCGYEVPWDEYAATINSRGYYPPRECIRSVVNTPGRCCSDCGAEWCEYLDVYYGTDAAEARRCVKCRHRRVA